MKKIKERGKSLWQRFKGKMPHVEICFSKLKMKSKASKAALVLVPLVLIGAGVGVGIGLTQNTNAPVSKVDVTNYKNRRIYLVSNDNITIPLTVSLLKRATPGEEIRDIFNLLKTDSKAGSNSIKGLIPASTKLNSLEIFNDELILDVSKEFLDYEKSSEVNLLESITYTFADFPDVKMLSIYVDGEKLEKMPKNNTVIPDFLQKRFGINRQTDDISNIANKQMVNIYYTKNIDDKSYLVPVSHYVDSNLSMEKQLIEAVSSTVENSLGLTICDEYTFLDDTQEDDNDKEFNLTVKQDALVNEGVVKKSLLDIISLTINDSYNKVAVNFYIEDETVMVEGVVSQDTYEVSNLIYNSVAI